MNEKLLHALIFLFGVLISAASQILLKKSAQTSYPNKLREYLNVRVITAYAVFFGATLCSITAYRGIPLSLGPILESAGYVFVAVLSRVFLKETIGPKKMLGLAIIVIGILVYSL